MTLRQMIDFKPSDLDMAMLPLEVTVYLKVHVISLYKEDNYAFLRYFFTRDIGEYFYRFQNTVFYDFDGTDTKQERFVTVFELYSVPKFSEIADLLKEVLEGYDHTADVIFDFFTHDNRMYRLSNLDGIVKLEEIHTDGTKEEVVIEPVEEPVEEIPEEPIEEIYEEITEEPVEEAPQEFNADLADEILKEAEQLGEEIAPLLEKQEGIVLEWKEEKKKEKEEEKITLVL